MISNSTYTQKTYKTFSAQHKDALPREFADATAADILNYWLERAESLKGTNTLVGDPICHYYAATFTARRQCALAWLHRLAGR
jgi:hypothetical protein